MKINSAKTVQVDKWVDVQVSHGSKKFVISVKTTNGKLTHKDHRAGIATSYISYFNKVSEKTRAKHYEQIRQYVEQHIK